MPLICVTTFKSTKPHSLYSPRHTCTTKADLARDLISEQPETQTHNTPFIRVQPLFQPGAGRGTVTTQVTCLEAVSLYGV